MYWRDDRPEEIDEWCLKGPKVTAHCVINAKKGKLGLYWLGEVSEEKLSVNRERCREKLNRINKDLNQLYTPNQKRFLRFQQHGATLHTAQSTMAHVHTLLGNKSVGLAGRAQMVFAWS